MTWSEVKKVGPVPGLAMDLYDLHHTNVFATGIENLSMYKPHSGKCNSSIEIKNTMLTFTVWIWVSDFYMQRL